MYKGAKKRITVHEEKILPYISDERLSTYRKFTASGSYYPALEIYIIAQMFSSYLFLPLQFLEVSLRNIIYLTFVAFYGKNQNTPPSRDPEGWLFWLPQNHKTKEAVTLANNSALRDVKTRTVRMGDVISRLSLGVWVNILSEQPDPKSPLHFWRFTARKIFPNAPKRKQTTVLHRLKEVKLIRNRLFHYEPIWSIDKCKTPRQIIEDIYKKYCLITDTTRWITLDTTLLLEAAGYEKMMKEIFDKSINEVEKQSTSARP
jgi:hypothetical protein